MEFLSFKPIFMPSMTLPDVALSVFLLLTTKFTLPSLFGLLALSTIIVYSTWMAPIKHP